ncbi:MAG: ABC transporter permease [Candidatus Omnitrophica bacterium]|nr:ABC transporter permease [Candidatus Omnitrophota bacterium]
MQKVIEQRDILFSLVAKNIKTKYAGSLLGVLWAFINPLLLALIVGFVFTQVFKANVENFYLFIIAGMFPWTFFASSLQEAAVSVPSNAAVLKQFSFSRMFIPLAVVLTNFIVFGCSLLVLLPFFIMVKSSVVFMLPLLLVAMFFLFLFTAGISLMLAAWCVEVRDINQFLGTLLMFWLWLTPVFYAADMVPAAYRGWFAFNPVNPYMELFRAALLGSGLAHPLNLLVVFASSVAVMWAGVVIFNTKAGNFLRRI